MIGFWNDGEDAALQGLSLEAQIIYLRGIRRFANKSGIAGIERRINRNSLIEVCHFLPDRGSKAKEERLTWDQVRRRLDELERAGLILRRDKLVFELPLAVQEKSVQMRMTRGRHEDDTPLTTPTEALLDKGFTGDDGTMTTRHQNADDDTTSPVTNINTHSRAHPAFSRTSPVDSRPVFRMSSDWKPGTGFPGTHTAYGFKAELFTSEVLAEFVGYWEAQGDSLTQAMWEHKLAGHLKTIGSRPAATVAHIRTSPTRPARTTRREIPDNDSTEWMTPDLLEAAGRVAK